MPRARQAKQAEAVQPPRAVRCAIYTRKSTDEGLDKEFNSLDAQRESAEAYIASQRGEGWTCLPDRYDDGGFSGGTLERPALKRLLMDVQEGLIDCVVTYKVDRLSRSLMDFTRIMEILDGNNVSFVSVTQAFNTTTSMGRLTLNILLSFAQFEREIIAERTQDKMSAARRKGKWVGGYPVLGYDIAPGGGRLVVNAKEAARVREIFKLYLQLESLLATSRELKARGWTNKLWKSQNGQTRGGKPFNKNSVYTLLTNMTYIGKVYFRGEVYQGEHEAIVDEVVWRQVQEMITGNGVCGGTAVRNKHGALLKGILYCVPCKAAMVHSMTKRRGRPTYRYYVCTGAQKNGWDTCPSKSVPAMEAEKFVVEQLRRVSTDDGLFKDVLEKAEKQAQVRRAELQTELKGLQSHVRADLQTLSRLKPQTPRYMTLREQIADAEKRIAAITENLQAVEKDKLDAVKAADIFKDFDVLWNALLPKERVRLVHLLVDRVGYDGAKSSITVTFRVSDIDALAQLQQEKA